jgi:hypothetical protein
LEQSCGVAGESGDSDGIPRRVQSFFERILNEIEPVLCGEELEMDSRVCCGSGNVSNTGFSDHAARQSDYA